MNGVPARFIARCVTLSPAAGIRLESMLADPFSGLSQAEADAAKALMADGGCVAERAVMLVRAVADVAAEEALGIIAGTVPVSGSVVDTRLERLRKIIEAMPPDSSFPNPYEVGVIFRITTSQASTLLKTYQARFTKDFRARVERGVKTAVGRRVTVEKRKKWVIEFADPVALDFAFDLLKRRGLTKTLARDPTAMTLTVDRDQTDRHGSDAVTALGCQVE